jgi:hypothetical protein
MELIRENIECHWNFDKEGLIKVEMWLSCGEVVKVICLHLLDVKCMSPNRDCDRCYILPYNLKPLLKVAE